MPGGRAWAGGHRLGRFAAGFSGPGDAAPLREAAEKGVIVVQATRAGSGRTYRTTKLRESGFLIADNLTPQKARILLGLAATVTTDPDKTTRIFRVY